MMQIGGLTLGEDKIWHFEIENEKNKTGEIIKQ